MVSSSIVARVVGEELNDLLSQNVPELAEMQDFPQEQPIERLQAIHSFHKRQTIYSFLQG